jgi:CheY-like chemotaxis protein
MSTISPRQCSLAGKSRYPAPPLDTDAASNAVPKVVKKVLVVDDETDLADVASMLLSAHGLDVVTAYSAQEALQQLDQDPQIDAVMSDIMMPGMNGLELGDAIRAMYPHLKVILVSGYTLVSEFDGRERPYLFAAKPYKIATILTLLRS